MKEWARLFPPFFVSFDARVRHQRLHNHSELLNYGAGFAGLNLHTHATIMFLTMFASEILKLTYSDFILDRSESKHFKLVVQAGTNQILAEHFGTNLARYRTPGTDSPLEFFTIPVIDQLPPQMLRLETFPAFEKIKRRLLRSRRSSTKSNQS